MSDVPRICQFFLRGRCSRQKCEFRHPGEREFQALRDRAREREREAINISFIKCLLRSIFVGAILARSTAIIGV